jgi:hypothetical protein
LVNSAISRAMCGSNVRRGASGIGVQIDDAARTPYSVDRSSRTAFVMEKDEKSVNLKGG